MKYYPTTLTPDETAASVARITQHFTDRDFGLWAVEIPNESPFIGFVGLQVPSFEAHFTPCVEIGWRLAKRYWRKGYATEAARASLRFGFEELGLEEIVAMTVPANTPSRGVMEKLDMTHSAEDDFQFPLLPEGHSLKAHVLYRMSRQRFGSVASD